MVSESNLVEMKILSMLKECIPKEIRTKQTFMWSHYHTLHISPQYMSEWQKFFWIHCRYVYYWAMVYAGHFMFKELIKSGCTVQDVSGRSSPSLTYSEYNAQ